MEPKTYMQQSVEQAHEFFCGYRPHPPIGWWFCGQAKAEWGLVPKAGRESYLVGEGRYLGRFRAWSKVAVAYDPNLRRDDWERLAVAQHFGLATCLCQLASILYGGNSFTYALAETTYIKRTGL